MCWLKRIIALAYQKNYCVIQKNKISNKNQDSNKKEYQFKLKRLFH